jgi:predicted dehydrogenase
VLRRSPLAELRVVSDLDEVRARDVAHRYGARVADVPSLLADDDVEAVLIATPGNHAQIARDALRAGKHVLAEKPLALTVAEAEEVGALAEQAGRVLQVGYMKMYDAVIPPARRAVAEMGDIRLVEVSVRHPDDSRQTGHLRLTARTPLVPAAAEAARVADAEDGERVRMAVGDVPPAWQRLYRSVLCGSVLHELSLLRAVGIGLPESFDHADVFPWPTDGGPPSITATATLSPTSRLVLSWNWLPQYAQYEEQLRVLSADGGLRMDVAPPYVLDAPSGLEVVRAAEGGSGTRTTRTVAGFDGAFQRQLEAFAGSVRHGEPVLADAAGAAQDIRCLQQLFRTLAARHGVEVGGEAGRLP